MKKIPGRTLIKNLRLPNRINEVYVIGNLSNKSSQYLAKLFRKKIVHKNVPFGSAAEIFDSIKDINFKKSDLIILTIPTPKQEQVAEKIRYKNKYFKILCIGGAVNMASGEEKPVPDYIDKIGLEFLWRLRTDPLRRLWRLLNSFYSYCVGNINRTISTIQVNIIK